MSWHNVPKKRTIAFIVPYPYDQAPGQRFRYEQYLPQLKTHFDVKVFPFLDTKTNQLLYKSNHPIRKIIGILTGYIKRFLIIPQIAKAHFVFIFREATPLGPPFFEWITAKLLKKKIIYDFDDAIWLTDRPRESRLLRFLKWRSKVCAICRWSYKISCGNDYLAEYARKHNTYVIVNPTTIDTEETHNPFITTWDTPSISSNDQVIIGWTGSHSTLKYLIEIESTLREIEQRHPFISFLVIADTPPEINLKNLIFRKWSKEHEIGDLMAIDIGIMPLPTNPWTQGKCGFKALQYMALEKPAVVSPVGVNKTIIAHGINGYLCEDKEAWLDTLELLIYNKALRERIGKQARKTVINHYSVASNSPVFFSLFKE